MIKNLTSKSQFSWKITFGLIASVVGSVLQPLTPVAYAAVDDPLPHNPRPAYVYNYPQPTVTVDSTEATDLGPWLTGTVVPILKDWYPVLADTIIGAPKTDYPLVGSFTIKASATYTGYMQVNPGNVIIFNANAIRSNKPGAPGAFMHEVAHVVHQNKSGAFWVQEGTADFIRAYVYGDYSLPNAANQTYLNGYMQSANFINYIQSVSPNFVSRLAYPSSRPAGSTGYKTTTVQTLTGVSTENHWFNYTGHTITPVSNVKPGSVSKCMELPNYATADGTNPDIWGCTTGDHQKWVFVDKATATGGMIQGYYGVKCLRVSGRVNRSGGHPVDYGPCTGANDQIFKHRTDSTIYHVSSNSCLRPVAGGVTDGTKLETVGCLTTATNQKWTFTATP